MSDNDITIEMTLSEAKALAFFVPESEETYTDQGINLANAHAKLANAIRKEEVKRGT
jgi:hypothetical protein